MAVCKGELTAQLPLGGEAGGPIADMPSAQRAEVSELATGQRCRHWVSFLVPAQPQDTLLLQPPADVLRGTLMGGPRLTQLLYPPCLQHEACSTGFAFLTQQEGQCFEVSASLTMELSPSPRAPSVHGKDRSSEVGRAGSRVNGFEMW